MAEHEAKWWVLTGVVLVVIGSLLVRDSEVMLLELWGVGFLLIGSVIGIVGLGVLLRLWR